MLTPWLDLRGGEDCWKDDPKTIPAADALPDHPVDVAIIGAGVTGAVLADHLTAQGREVVILDRRAPATGSTGASTALVLWAPDVPLLEHIVRYGRDGAQARWRAVFDSVQALAARVNALDLPCGWAARPDLYLAGARLDAIQLRAEAEARQSAGLPSTWIDAAETRRRFGVRGEAAVVSGGAYEVDPVALTRGLLRTSQGLGARLCHPLQVLALHETAEGVRLDLDGGLHLRSRHVIVATGYETEPDLPPGFKLSSSYAIASPPGQAAAWRERAMIWEAADPYLYLRTTVDARIVVGGEDEAFADPVRRDGLIPKKSLRLAEKACGVLGLPDFRIDRAWAATFGGSEDGLPAIGLRPGCRQTYVAHSFGGNGIAFAALAARCLGGVLDHRSPPEAALFLPDRFMKTDDGRTHTNPSVIKGLP